MGNAKLIKTLFIEMEAAEVACDRAEELYSITPDERHEKEFDTCYKVSFETTEKLVKELCKLGYDAKTWRKVLATKRTSIKDLCNRLAA